MINYKIIYDNIIYEKVLVTLMRYKKYELEDNNYAT
jgi:hypothetical protein